MTTSPSDVLEELALLEQSLEGMEWQDRKGKKQLPPIPGKQAGPLLQRVALAPKIDFDRGKMSQALAQLQDGMNNLLKGPTLSDIEASIDALAEDLQSDNVETITKSKSAEQHAPPTSLGQAQLANLDLLSPAPAPATGTDSKPSPATSLLGNLSFYSEPDTPVDHTTGPDSSMHSIQLESHQPNSLPLVVASQSTPAPLPPSLAPPAPTLVPDTPPVIVAPIVAAPPLAVSSVPPPAPIAASGTPSPAAQPAPEASPTPASVPVSPLPSTIQPESSISRPTLDDPEFWTTLPVLVSTPEVAPLPSTVQPESSMSHSHSPLDDPEFWMMPEDEEPSLVSTGMFSLESTWVPNVTISAVADTGAGAAEAPPQALDEFAEETPEEFSLDALLSSADPDAISDDQVFFNPGRFSQRITVDYRQTTRRETISENPGFAAPPSPTIQDSSRLQDSSFLNRGVSGKDSLAFGLYGSTITVEATLPSGQVKRYEISTSATVDQLRKKIWILSGQSFDKDAVLLYQRAELAGFRKFTRAHPGIQADMERSGVVPVTFSLPATQRRTLPPGALSPIDLEIEQIGRPSLPVASGQAHAWATPSPRHSMTAPFAPEPKTSLAIGRRPSGSHTAAASPDRAHYIQLPKLLTPYAPGGGPVAPPSSTSPSTSNSPISSSAPVSPTSPTAAPITLPIPANTPSSPAPSPAPPENVPLILPEDGYTIEPEPQHLVGDLKTVLTLYKPEDNIAYYRTWFLPVAHTSLMGRKGDQIVIVSFTNEAHNGKYKILVWQAKGTSRHLLDGSSKTVRLNKLKSIVLDFLKPTVPVVAELSLEVIREASFSSHLLTVEGTQVVQAYKFGLLYAKEGQTIEEEMFSNTTTSPEYEDFLRFLGDQVTLSGWEKYRAGLDCKGTNTTGTHSVYTQFMGYEVMFHVSTLLPYSTHDMQQLERKRHIGNDIVVLVFMDGRTPYHPGTISSEFNHVFVVVQPVTIQGEQCYKIGCVTKDGVPAIPPALDSLIFKKNNSFRYLLLTKLINAERCSYGAPVFAQKITRTRKSLLKEIYSACKGED